MRDRVASATARRRAAPPGGERGRWAAGLGLEREGASGGVAGMRAPLRRQGLGFLRGARATRLRGRAAHARVRGARTSARGRRVPLEIQCSAQPRSKRPSPPNPSQKRGAPACRRAARAAASPGARHARRGGRPADKCSHASAPRIQGRGRGRATRSPLRGQQHRVGGGGGKGEEAGRATPKRRRRPRAPKQRRRRRTRAATGRRGVQGPARHNRAAARKAARPRAPPARRAPWPSSGETKSPPGRRAHHKSPAPPPPPPRGTRPRRRR